MFIVYGKNVFVKFHVFAQIHARLHDFEDYLMYSIKNKYYENENA